MNALGLGRLVSLLLFAGAPLLAQDAPPPPSAERVTVTADGANRDEALRRALRKALEQGARGEIATHAGAEDFRLIRDTLYSRATGVITEYQIVGEQTRAGGMLELKVEAVVRADAVARAWAQVRSLLDRVGRPKIMVVIDESIDGQRQPESVVAAKIEELLLASGFDLVSRAGTSEVLQREQADAQRSGDAARAAALAKDAGAQLLIRGVANSNRAGLENLYGVPGAFYNCDVQVQVYYADTARLLVSESMPTTRMGVRSRHEFSPQAARAALVQATLPEAENPALPVPLALRVHDGVLAAWSTQLLSAGDVAFDVDSLDFKSFAALQKALAELPDVRSVDGEFSKSVGTFRLKTSLSAAELAQRLAAPPFDRWLEVTEQKLNRISAKAVGRP